MKNLKLLLTLALVAVTMSAAAQKTLNINLWSSGAPNSNGDDNDSAKVRVFLPQTGKSTGRAVVICPGGGYSHLAMDHEGYDWAPFFNKMGIAVVVLKYRMPHGNLEVPVSDAEEAVKLTRRNAVDWHIDPNDIGIMGSSAGGHLASTIATHADKDAFPNFQILFYPVITMQSGYTHQGSHDNFLGKDAKKKMENEYSNDMKVTRNTSRAFIALSDDDSTVLPANGVNYYCELSRHDVPSSLHVYPSGGHGWGFRESFAFHIEMELELKAWLQSF